MKYSISFTDDALNDIDRLEKNEPKAYKKFTKFLSELVEHPHTGTSHPEPLKGYRSGQWSRTITKKHRLVYEVHDEMVLVLVLSAYGHYDDK